MNTLFLLYFLYSIFFILGLILIIKGGDIFVDASIEIAKILKLPEFVVGALIVSIATSLPEIAISLLSAYNGETEMAIGNAIGSVTINTSLILALTLLFLDIKTKNKYFFIQGMILILSALVLFAGSLNGYLILSSRVILITLFFVFIISNIKIAKNEKNLYTTNENNVEIKNKKTILLNFIISLIIIFFSSKLLIYSSLNIASIMGVSERIVSITLLAIGTSLPELTTTIIAIRKRNTELSIGNIVGANIIDIALALPLCSIISQRPIAVSEEVVMLDFPVCIIVILIAVIPCFFTQKRNKIIRILQGLSLIYIYTLYLEKLII